MGTAMLVSNIALWVVVIVQCIIIYFLARMTAEFMNRFRITGQQIENATLKVGEKAPSFREQNQDGDMIRLAEPNTAYTLLMFVSGTCSICDAILPKLHELQKVYDLRTITVSKASLSFDKPLNPATHHVKSDELFQSYMVQAVPTVFLIHSSGHIEAIETVTSFEQLKIYLGLFFRGNVRLG
ncbi:hypothetical protein CBW65_06070 [Tumebacillus avium]|uniref:Thioredoxin domain-containing protein n=1 Tax=Tumebacillus avium TaxID=1903704 RepID=A0A1Y0IJP5_9BACL|nr:conjugal transfer protein TraF [Tumebacillus avium]ARU60698.1 hypothetical protein CBW65_06070 [Tumebacillus avium]